MGEDTIHYITMGVMTSKKEEILAFDNEDKIIAYLKTEVMRDTFEKKKASIGGILLMDHLLEYFEKNNIVTEGMEKESKSLAK